MGAAAVTGNLVKAEWRKLLSTNLWWALLIPTAALALIWAWVASALGSTIADAVTANPVFQRLGLSLNNLPIEGFALARAINVSTIFPMIVGGLAVASEMQRRTITTTFLTAPSRGRALSAKLIAYLLVGVAYGVVIVGMASVGILIGSQAHTDLLPSAGQWLALVGTGLLSSVLWTLLAVGVGALLGNAIATLLTLILYTLIVENLAMLKLPGHIPGFFPNQAADGLTSSVASSGFLDKLGYIPSEFRDPISLIVHAAAGSRGAYGWWAEGLIFLAWTVIFVGAGWLVTKRRDIA